MLTLTAPVNVAFNQIRVDALIVHLDATLHLSVSVADGAGNRETFPLVADAVSRQGLRVGATGRLGVYSEAASGYAAALFTAFAGAAGGVAPKFRAVESKLATDGLLPAGAVS